MVSIHGVPVNVLLIISVVYLIFRFKRGTAMPRLDVKVVGIPLYIDVEKQPHA